MVNKDYEKGLAVSLTILLLGLAISEAKLTSLAIAFPIAALVTFLTVKIISLTFFSTKSYKKPINKFFGNVKRILKFDKQKMQKNEEEGEEEFFSQRKFKVEDLTNGKRTRPNQKRKKNVSNPVTNAYEIGRPNRANNKAKITERKATILNSRFK